MGVVGETCGAARYTAFRRLALLGLLAAPVVFVGVAPVVALVALLFAESTAEGAADLGVLTPEAVEPRVVMLGGSGRLGGFYGA